MRPHCSTMAPRCGASSNSDVSDLDPDIADELRTFVVQSGEYRPDTAKVVVPLPASRDPPLGASRARRPPRRAHAAGQSRSVLQQGASLTAPAKPQTPNLATAGRNAADDARQTPTSHRGRRRYRQRRPETYKATGRQMTRPGADATTTEDRDNTDTTSEYDAARTASVTDFRLPARSWSFCRSSAPCV